MRYRNWLRTSFGVSLLALGAAGCSPASRDTDIAASTQMLASVPRPAEISLPPAFGFREPSVTYVVREERGSRVVVAGGAGPEYAAIEPFGESPFGAVGFYVANTEGGERVAMLNQRALDVDLRNPPWVVFSPGGDIAFANELGDGRWCVFRTDSCLGSYDDVGGVAFSEDDRLAYAVQKEESGATVLVVEGEELVLENDELDDPDIYWQGGAILLRSRSAATGKWVLYRHARRLAEWDYLANVTTRGRRLFYLAKNGDEQFVVVDGDKGWNCSAYGLLAVSANGKHVACVNDAPEDKEFLIVDGREYGPYAKVTAVTLDDGGSHAVLEESSDGRAIVVNGETRITLSSEIKHVQLGGFVDGGRRIAFGTVEETDVRGTPGPTEIWWHVESAGSDSRIPRMPSGTPDLERSRTRKAEFDAYCAPAPPTQWADVSDLVGRLYGPDRIGAARSLGRIGPPAGQAVADLVGSLAGENLFDIVRYGSDMAVEEPYAHSAAVALGRIMGARAVMTFLASSTILTGIRGIDSTGTDALWAFILSESGDASLACIRRGLLISEPRQIRVLLSALNLMMLKEEVPIDDVIETLEELRDHPSAEIRRAAAQTILNIGSAAEPRPDLTIR